ncbi:transcriptional activator DEMETER-like [Syzygium oleosum]|uniref:transcriptional activator DEMETER-like n=1 Tax=Syzygium oleosum TaxID=219896 RepID=UPI0024BBB5F6|nr:transcriptional activator DEMETER-like [Syzygium oleosum]
MDVIVKGASDVETRKDKDVHQVKRKHYAEVDMRKARMNLSWQWLSRPKVDIDYETTRVWALLNEFGSECAEKEIERDIDKKRYWEEERKRFHEQTLSFVTKMRRVQGDRCFMEWKGSVVDSVVGAFLTQNVSDKNSSSSFIALAAKFPNRKMQKDYHHICPESRKKKARRGANSRGIKMCEDNDKKMYWESVRNLYSRGRHKEKNPRPLESLDWEAVSQADTAFLAKILMSRGMHDKLAERIQGFLHRLCRDHGSIDLEWLKNVPPNLVKQFLLTIEGLGLKSVECIRLLSLKQPAFPVDTNVGRIVVRLGWVPLQPMPETFQLHLLQKYPAVDDIQKYLWTRLCHLDHRTLYELHYHMITLGKVFCTKTQPNCNACPLRDECKHYGSRNEGSSILPQRSSYPPNGAGSRRTDVCIEDIEDIMVDPKHRVNELLLKETRPPLMPKVKHNVSRMTFPVFELPDSHPLLEGLCRREIDDAYPYLLAIWKPGFLSERNTRSFGNDMDRHSSDTVQGTILVPVRTALRGNFPLNGTYFQINEVLADDGSSRIPVNVQVDLIKNLTRRTLYCGASVLSICRGLSPEEVTDCFLRVPEKKEAFVVDCHHLNGGRITRGIDHSRQTQDWGFEAFYSCFV